MQEAYGFLEMSLPDGGKQEFELSKSQITLGRDPTNDIVLEDFKVSRMHARIEVDNDGGIKLVDLGSTNGSKLNDEKVTESQVGPGDVITLGDNQLHYKVVDPIQELAVTKIETETDLNQTIAEISLPISLNRTDVDRLVVHTPENTWEIDLDDKIDALTIGRAPENDIVLDHPSVSRTHARITRHHLTFKIKDLDSSNGIWVNGAKTDEVALEDGMLLRVGFANLIYKRGFHAENLTIVGTTFKLPKRTPVVFVPGIMGSELWHGDTRIWPNLKLLLKQPELFKYPGEPGIEPRGILQEVVIVPNLIKMEQYSRLGDYLVQDLGYERGKDFFEFAYDWRQDIRLSARQLGRFIESLEAHSIKLIGHSLGTLVSRYYVERLGGKEKVQRLILMGGPHYGTPAGVTSLMFGPGVLPFGIMGETLRKVIATYPTAYQILPVFAWGRDQQKKPFNFMKDKSWLSEEQWPLWELAREFKKELGMKTSVPTTCIFGYGHKTIDEINLHRKKDGRFSNFAYLTRTTGDDSVPQNSAILEGADIHPVHQHHGALFVDNDVKMRLKLELIGKPFM
ncbi:MAG: alpha/beta fold hydrolase [Anaerolineales bacterium]